MRVFTRQYKMSQGTTVTDLFMRVADRKRNGKEYTIHMVTNWIYGRCKNPELEKELSALLTARGETIPDTAYEIDVEELENA